MSKQKTNDMTVGNPVKLIIQFMIPMFLGNIFQQFYNIVDSIVAGQFIGVDALAAIGSTGSLMFFVTGWLNGLSSGFAILVSQWFGAKQYDKILPFVEKQKLDVWTHNKTIQKAIESYRITPEQKEYLRGLKIKK